MKINNRATRRAAGLRARRNLMAHSSATTAFFKKAANRKVRHADYVGNGGAYKAVADINWVLGYHLS